MIGETVTQHAYTGSTKNAHNRETPVYQDVPVENVGVDVPDASEPRDPSTNRQVVALVIFVPANITVSGRDQFTVRGNRYGVEGDPGGVRNFFTGTTFPTEVKLRKVTG